MHKRNNRWPALAFLFLLALTVTCRRADVQTPAPTDTNGPTLGAHEVSVTGIVLDNTGQPVVDATVRVGEKTTVSDAGGYFEVTGAHVDDEVYVRIDKAGYFPGSRTMIRRPESVYEATVRLLPKNVSGTFDAAGGGTVPTAQGGSIEFSAGSVVTSSGTPYTGTVEVATYVFNPTSVFFAEQMPGDLRGLRANGERTLIESFGMMAVELMGSGGQKLQLAAGKPATIQFPVPAALRATAPATIPLWYFDEAKGIWKEEGQAQFNGTRYQGSVRHFSFWNCDIAVPSVLFDITVHAANAGPVAGALVELRGMATDSIRTVGGFTNGQGFVQGLVPANRQLRMRILDRCGTVLHSAVIGPFAVNTSYGTVSLTNYNFAGAYILKGTVTACNGQPMPRGRIDFQFPVTPAHIVVYGAQIVNGQYSKVILPCGRVFTTPITARVYDSSGGWRSMTDTIRPVLGTPLTYNTSVCTPFSTQNLSFVSGATLERTRQTGAGNDLGGAWNAGTGALHGWSTTAASGRQLSFDVVAAPGTVSGNGRGTRALSMRYQWPSANGTRVLLADSAYVHFRKFGAVGDFITASYTGHFRDSVNPGQRFYLYGDFYVKRTQ
ncbi:carboxypeptidase-like regulatory domain-containing protein [Flaviaesturariibacter amylovorans]|uniref:Carboxypeptidase regulatory-like domain-containing protein n=1 Tax=Flaviaesturariibacter amylovorans TaxID=1084520 RepID=A0ABP8GI51_9BACT